MGRVRNMPTRKKIYEYWLDKLDYIENENTCFKCGYTSSSGTAVDRAHILSVFDGGSDECENLHLLCGNCHLDSEPYNGKVYDLWFENKEFTKERFQMCLSANIYFNNIDYPELHDELSAHWNKFIEKNGKEKCDNIMKSLL